MAALTPAAEQLEAEIRKIQDQITKTEGQQEKYIAKIEKLDGKIDSLEEKIEGGAALSEDERENLKAWRQERSDLRQENPALSNELVQLRALREARRDALRQPAAGEWNQVFHVFVYFTRFDTLAFSEIRFSPFHLSFSFYFFSLYRF